ncbi:hypothetical protein PBI_P106I_44 [Cutibacterium phage P106I]|nr:hypothetical protein PBI_P106I_44 [Cutibacterium phage P106I]
MVVGVVVVSRVRGLQPTVKATLIWIERFMGCGMESTPSYYVR